MESFSLDVDRGTLALTFNETMSNAPGEVDWTGVSLRSHVNGLEGFGVSLWNTQGEQGWGDAVSIDDGLTLAVDLHPIDLDDMKASYIGHNSSFTWLTLRAGSFVALGGGDGNEPIYGTQVVGHKGASVSELVQDTRRSVGSSCKYIRTTQQVGCAYGQALYEVVIRFPSTNSSFHTTVPTPRSSL